MLTNLINNLKINSMTEFNSKIKKNSRILKIFMFSICALFACAISSHAQSLVKGTVTDGIGEPLPGVSVVVKGTMENIAFRPPQKTFYHSHMLECQIRK